MGGTSKLDTFNHDPLECMDNNPSGSAATRSAATKPASPSGKKDNAGATDTAEGDLGDTRIVLDTMLNIEGVGSLHERLLSAFDQKGSLSIDGSKVESVDTSNLQLMIVLLHEAKGAGKMVRIVNPSEGFIRSAEMLGVVGILGLDQETA